MKKYENYVSALNSLRKAPEILICKVLKIRGIFYVLVFQFYVVMKMLIELLYFEV